MKRYVTAALFALAAVGAALLTTGDTGVDYEERLVGIAVEQTFGDAAPAIAAQPLAIQALLLDYAAEPGGEALVPQTRLALLRYPELAHRVLLTYGGEPEFQRILRNYGPAVLLPIAFFMDHELTSLEWRHRLGDAVDDVTWWLSDVFGAGATGDARAAPSEDAVGATAETLTPEQRGLWAIAFVGTEGHDLLGQFVMGADGEVEWVQTERVLQDVRDLFFGGLSNVERKRREGQEIRIGDVAGAVIDLAAIVASIKVLKALTAFRSAPRAVASVGFPERVALLGSRVLQQSGRLGAAVARYGAIPAAAYLMLRHPSLINATLVELAGWLGVPPAAVQFAFWFVALWLLMRVTLTLISPLSWVIGTLAGLLARLVGWTASPGTRGSLATAAAGSGNPMAPSR
jgi:hypothetical protein